jgi:splicing factor 3B subunit 2
MPESTAQKKQKRRKKKKQIEKRELLSPSAPSEAAADAPKNVEYTVEVTDIPEEFRKAFDKFTIPLEELNKERRPNEDDVEGYEERNGMHGDGHSDQTDESDAAEDDEDDDDYELDLGEIEREELSKKKKRKENRPTVAYLKALVEHPEVIEWWDVSAADPLFLVHLKATRNTVPVPPHWSLKRKYLQGKRGIEKPPFELPSFISATGITTMREAMNEIDRNKSLKAKMRQKTRPKMNKMVLDYGRLHDAFFRFQTKPFMTKHGDLYYEGKEFEVRMKEKKPGVLSKELKEALGMANELIPPPWLVNMQRFGPPPSYPNIKIPGLNAPIPQGAQWGYHPGGWGKPPVDQFGRPLYGDVFGYYTQYHQQMKDSVLNSAFSVPVEKRLWGEIESILRQDSDDEAEEEEEDAGEGEAAQQEGNGFDANVQVQANVENFDEDEGPVVVSPENISNDVNNHGASDNEQEDEADALIREALQIDVQKKQLYTVIPEKTVSQSSENGVMKSEKIYDLGTEVGKPKEEAEEQPVVEKKERVKRRFAETKEESLEKKRKVERQRQEFKF